MPSEQQAFKPFVQPEVLAKLPTNLGKARAILWAASKRAKKEGSVPVRLLGAIAKAVEFYSLPEF